MFYPRYFLFGHTFNFLVIKRVLSDHISAEWMIMAMAPSTASWPPSSCTSSPVTPPTSPWLASSSRWRWRHSSFLYFQRLEASLDINAGQSAIQLAAFIVILSGWSAVWSSCRFILASWEQGNTWPLTSLAPGPSLSLIQLKSGKMLSDW